MEPELTRNGVRIDMKSFFFLFLLKVIFLNYFSGKFGGIQAKWCLKCFDLKKCTQHEMTCSPFVFFWSSFSLEFFSGKFGEIWTKILRTPQNLPAPTPMLVTDTTH